MSWNTQSSMPARWMVHANLTKSCTSDIMSTVRVCCNPVPDSVLPATNVAASLLCGWEEQGVEGQRKGGDGAVADDCACQHVGEVVPAQRDSSETDN
mmetsp:Transcript_48664/g.97399  ORF Transcript_48664/g.97399 Transcript_48664/m.97399 type:complete len:97 (-) Transcript_48664:65-355(-)